MICTYNTRTYNIYAISSDFVNIGGYSVHETTRWLIYSFLSFVMLPDG